MSSASQNQVELIQCLEPNQLLIVWGDGHETLYTYKALRGLCSCANCVNEMTGEQILNRDAVADSIRVKSWEATGRYAVSFTFTDGHSSGIYQFRMLRQSCPCPECASA